MPELISEPEQRKIRIAAAKVAGQVMRGKGAASGQATLDLAKFLEHFILTGDNR